MINDVAMRYGEAVQGTKLSSRFANGTVRLSGMTYWTDSMKRAFQMLIGFHAAEAAEKGISDPHFKSMLERYGIDEATWEIIKTAQKAEIQGQKMITPMSIRMLGNTVQKPTTETMPLDDIAVEHPELREKIIKKERQDYADKINLVRDAAVKYAAMLTEEADRAIVTPGTREYAFIKNSTKPGTLPGS